MTTKWPQETREFSDSWLLILTPTGQLQWRGNRHPITHLGIGYILASAAKDVTKAQKNKDAVFTYEGVSEIYGRKAHQIKTVYPDNKGYYAHIVQLYYDDQIGLPLKITMFDWKNEFIEEYGWFVKISKQILDWQIKTSLYKQLEAFLRESPTLQKIHAWPVFQKKFSKNISSKNFNLLKSF